MFRPRKSTPTQPSFDIAQMLLLCALALLVGLLPVRGDVVITSHITTLLQTGPLPLQFTVLPVIALATAISSFATFQRRE